MALLMVLIEPVSSLEWVMMSYNATTPTYKVDEMAFSEVAMANP